MNERISQVIVIILNNRLVCVDTNTSGLHRKIKTIEPSFYGYDKLHKLLKTNDYLTFEIEDKTYHIEIYRNK